MASLPECPPSLKSLQHYLKTASEHDGRDPVAAYWCRLHALQLGLKLSSKKTPEETKLLMAIMDWLEEQKKVHPDNEAITNDVAAQAHLDNYALKLFLYADKQDREQNYGKNIVKAFYTAGMIYDVLTEFGELSEEATQNRKYAKWKAAYIHNCLKNGETPVPGPMPTEGEEGEANDPSGEQNNQPPVDTLIPGLPTPSLPTPDFPSPSPRSNPQPSNSGLNPTPSSFSSNLPDASVVNQLPTVPYTPDPNPGGFVPYTPSRNTNPVEPAKVNVNIQLAPEQIAKAQKYCKWASSALNYDDIATAVTNLSNALQLLQTGRDPA